jgi:hypothetical protein
MTYGHCGDVIRIIGCAERNRIPLAGHPPLLNEPFAADPRKCLFVYLTESFLGEEKPQCK